MQKILVLGSTSTDIPELQSKKDMLKYLTEAINIAGGGGEVYGCFLDEIGYVVSNDQAKIYDLRNNRDISEYDIVYIRGKVRVFINDVALVSSYLNSRNKPVITSAYKNRRATGKVPQMYQLQQLGYPIPYSVSASPEYLPKLIKEHLTYPVIVKDMHGGHGNDNYLVHDEKELQSVLEDRSEIRFIAQEFIANDGDFRVLCVGDKDVLIIHRKGTDGSHLNNTSKGGSAELIPPGEFPAEIIQQAQAYAKSCEYEIAGVDVMVAKGTDKHYFLEINSQPQLMTGAFVAEKQVLVGKFFKQLLDRPV